MQQPSWLFAKVMLVLNKLSQNSSQPVGTPEYDSAPYL